MEEAVVVADDEAVGAFLQQHAGTLRNEARTAELAAAARVNEYVGKRLPRRGIGLGRHDHVYALPVVTQRRQRVVERAFATARNVPVAAEHEKIRRALLCHRVHTYC